MRVAQKAVLSVATKSTFSDSSWRASHHGFRVSRVVAVALISGALLSCDGNAKADLEARLKTNEVQLAALRSASAERDSVTNQVMEATRFVNEIQSELSRARSRSASRVRPVKLRTDSAERPVRSRAEILEDLRDVLSRLDSAEARVATLARRSSGPEQASLQLQVNSLRETIASLRAAAADQQRQVDELSSQLAKVRGERDQLARERAGLADRLLAVQDKANTVFMIARPVDQLLELGILVEQGKKRGFLGIGSSKGVLIPGRDLHEADFSPLSRTADTVLILPHPERRYTIISQHNGQLLAPPPGSDGTITGRVRIVDPARFWAVSRFLILAER
jgi:uncharacterized coiled-coil protein SlyX